MAFDDYENSRQDSRAVELYEFSFEGGLMRYTSADRDVTFNSVLWKQHQVDRTKIDESGDISKANLTLTAEADFEAAALFDPYPPDSVVGLVVYRVQWTPQLSEAIWLGRVLSAGWPKNQSELHCESIFTLMTQPGLRRIYSKNCPHLLYGARCKASEAAFQEVATVSSTAGRAIVSADFDAFPDGFFAGGKVVYEKSPGVFARRGIKQHTGDTIIVSHPIPSLTPGASVTILPGCVHTVPTCVSKFSNLVNYGGMPGMKRNNPFGASSVY